MRLGFLVIFGFEGKKRLEEVIPHLHQKKNAQSFLNEMSSRKQTICRPKRLHVVCATQT
ncbi:hypothetical protein HanIR_Chr11g0549471 [Helianthus annuus]|nr:hypothetical protein HanIR_Chr11g0549471 [Helianthus annuus]